MNIAVKVLIDCLTAFYTAIYVMLILIILRKEIELVFMLCDDHGMEWIGFGCRGGMIRSFCGIGIL